MEISTQSITMMADRRENEAQVRTNWWGLMCRQLCHLCWSGDTNIFSSSSDTFWSFAISVLLRAVGFIFPSSPFWLTSKKSFSCLTCSHVAWVKSFRNLLSIYWVSQWDYGYVGPLLDSLRPFDGGHDGSHIRCCHPHEQRFTTLSDLEKFIHLTTGRVIDHPNATRHTRFRSLFIK